MPESVTDRPQPARQRHRRRYSWRSRWTAAVGMMSTAALASVPILAPARAEAAPDVPDTAALAGELAEQELNWERCDFGSPATNDRFNQPNVSCATVVVPQDWHNPDNGETWQIRISQAHNIATTNRRYEGTMFVNPGGPGGSGLPWGAAMQERTPDLNPYYNYVGFDPRGVGQSSTTECTYEWDPNSSDPQAELKALGAACSADPQVKTITTEQTAYDMDFIRHLLGAPKMTYVGYSYGSWLGAWYENIFGAEYGDRFLLDSALDATMPTLQGGWDLQPIARDRQFRTHMMNWIARNDETYQLGENPREIYQQYFDATEDMDDFVVFLIWALTGATSAFPDNSQYPAAGNAVATLIGDPEAATTTRASANTNPAAIADALLTEAEASADAETADQLAEAQLKLAPLLDLETTEQQDQTARRGQTTRTATLESAFDIIRCNDGQWTQGAAYWNNHNSRQAEKAPLSRQWGLLDVPACAYWRTNNLMPVAEPDGFPQTIVAQSELDSQTGWEGGKIAGTQLPNTSFMAVDNEGSHGLFPYGTEELDRPIYDFFLHGQQPPAVSVSQALPLPGEDQTYESWAPLDANADHVVMENPDPWLPAPKQATKVPASTAGNDLLVAAATEPVLREQVRKVYGEAGVEALEESGALS